MKFWSKNSPQSRKIRKNHDFHSNFSLFFFKIWVFCVEKLQEKIKVSTESKRKFKNSSIQPRTSRSNFGQNSLNFEKITPRGAWQGRSSRSSSAPRRVARSSSLPSHQKICFPFFLLFFLFFSLFLCSFLKHIECNEIQ